MDTITIAQEYFNAWNQHDSAAILKMFAKTGKYTDPVAGQVHGTTLAGYADGLFNAFPDLSFEINSVVRADSDKVVARWNMKGTNTGLFNGLPPTDRTVTLPGADFITMTDEGITSVEGYFDSRVVPEQLGLQVIVQPETVESFTLGSCVYLQSGKCVKPGAFSLTTMVVRSPEEKETVRENSLNIMKDMMQMEGFISTVGIAAGNRMSTITAWESVHNTNQLVHHPAHKESVMGFFNNDFATSAMTSVWGVDHMNALWVRCKSCGRVVDFEKTTRRCTCGSEIHEVPYW
jgi:steroid delta-isomerase-like uncharacterized protein